MPWQDYSGWNRYRMSQKPGVDVNMEREPRNVQCCHCGKQFEKSSRSPGKHWCPECRKLKGAIQWQKRKGRSNGDSNRAVATQK